MALEVGEASRSPGSGCAIRICGSFWNDRRDRHHRDVVLHVVEGAEHAAAHVEVDLAGGEQLAVVDLRPARPDGHLQAVFLVDPVGHRLIEAAMLGLGLPVGAEGDLIERPGGAAEAHESKGHQQRDARRHGPSPRPEAAPGGPLGADRSPTFEQIPERRPSDRDPTEVAAARGHRRPSSSAFERWQNGGWGRLGKAELRPGADLTWCADSLATSTASEATIAAGHQSEL